MKRLISILTFAAVVSVTGIACTSAIIGAKASQSGRPMLWKNRDTGTEHNFVERVPARAKGEYGYVALYNGGDSLLTEAWMGMNDAGFAIMNTASYNLAPDTAKIKDREGVVMSRALQVCRTVEDFKNLLDTLPKPMGVQANFGVIDTEGNGAYFETDDYSYKAFYLKDTDNDVLVRTNFSFTGNETDGMGYIRFDNANRLLAEDIANRKVTPESFTENCSRSFYHSLLGKDMAADASEKWVVDQDFIPRRSTSASVVIEGAKPGESAEAAVMWTAIGYPPVSHVQAVFTDLVPEGLRPLEEGFRSKDCNETLERKSKAFPIKTGSGSRYLDMDYIREEQAAQREQAAESYIQGRAERDRRASR